MGSSLIHRMGCYIVNYFIFLIDVIYFDLQHNMLSGIILFPLSMGSSLIYRMWAFSIIHNWPLGSADWALILGWRLRPERFNGRTSSLGLASGPASPLFQTLSVAPQPLCTMCVGKGCNVSRTGCNFHVSAQGWVS